MNAPLDDDEIGRLRVPPHSVQAEQSVIGALLLDCGCFDAVSDAVRPEDFYAYHHRLIFSEIAALAAADKPADVITVFERLEARGKAGDVGGLEYLNAMAQSVPSARAARRYAEIVAEKALRRQLIAACDEAATIAFGSEDTGVALEKAAAIFGRLERGTLRKVPKSLAELMPQRIDRISALQDGRISAGISTGIGRLDRALSGGLRPGQVYILAARPSVGKSSFAQAIGLYVAERVGAVLMLSQEMPEGEVADRALSSIGRINYEAIQTGKLAMGDWEALTETASAGANVPFYVDDQPSLRVSDMRAKARQVRGLKLVILDYLQLSVAEAENRTQEVGQISRGVKRMAKELGVPVVVLSQLSRKVEERTGKEPELSDLRESGDIEQDADVVAFLWPIRDLESGAKLVGCKLDKNRQGKRVRFGLDFDGAHQRWAESTENIDEKKPAKASGRPL